MRHHRLLETYLAEHLGVPWDRVHEEAEALEHVLSRVPRGADRGQARPPDPRPARRPDPLADPEIDESETVCLSDLEAGDRGVSCASRTPTRRCCATSTSAASRLGDALRSPGAPAVRRAVDGALRRRVARARRHARARDARRSSRVTASRPRRSRQARPEACGRSCCGWARLTRLAAACLRRNEARLRRVCPPPGGPPLIGSADERASSRGVWWENCRHNSFPTTPRRRANSSSPIVIETDDPAVVCVRWASLAEPA